MRIDLEENFYRNTWMLGFSFSQEDIEDCPYGKAFVKSIQSGDLDKILPALSWYHNWEKGRRSSQLIPLAEWMEVVE